MVKHSPSPHGRILNARTLWTAAGAGRAVAARISGAVSLAGGARMARRQHRSGGNLPAGTRDGAMEAPRGGGWSAGSCPGFGQGVESDSPTFSLRVRDHQVRPKSFTPLVSGRSRAAAGMAGTAPSRKYSRAALAGGCAVHLLRSVAWGIA